MGSPGRPATEKVATPKSPAAQRMAASAANLRQQVHAPESISRSTPVGGTAARAVASVTAPDMGVHGRKQEEPDSTEVRGAKAVPEEVPVADAPGRAPPASASVAPQADLLHASIVTQAPSLSSTSGTFAPAEPAARKAATSGPDTNVHAWRGTALSDIFDRCDPGKDGVVSKADLVKSLRQDDCYVAGFFGITGPSQDKGVQSITEAVSEGDALVITWRDFVQRAEKAAGAWTSGQPSMASATTAVPASMARDSQLSEPQSIMTLPAEAAAAVSRTPTSIAPQVLVRPHAAPGMDSGTPGAPMGRGWQPTDPRELAAKPASELRQLLERKRAAITSLEEGIDWMQTSQDAMQVRVQNLEYLLRDVNPGDEILVNSTMLMEAKQVIDANTKEAHEAAVDALAEAAEHPASFKYYGYNKSQDLVMGRSYLGIDRTELAMHSEEEIRLDHIEAAKMPKYSGHIGLPPGYFHQQEDTIFPTGRAHHGQTQFDQMQDQISGTQHEQAPAFQDPAQLLPGLHSEQPHDSSWAILRGLFIGSHDAHDRIGEAKRGIVPQEPPPKQVQTGPTWLY